MALDCTIPKELDLDRDRKILVLHHRFRVRAVQHQQPVVKVRRCTEGGEAPRRQGATTENIGNI